MNQRKKSHRPKGHWTNRRGDGVLDIALLAFMLISLTAALATSIIRAIN